jgi:hypothetical protein
MNDQHCLKGRNFKCEEDIMSLKVSFVPNVPFEMKTEISSVRGIKTK